MAVDIKSKTRKPERILKCLNLVVVIARDTNSKYKLRLRKRRSAEGKAPCLLLFWLASDDFVFKNPQRGQAATKKIAHGMELSRKRFS